jgi:hypothetical protein
MVRSGYKGSKRPFKTTAILPKDLLGRAVKASGKNITATIHMGLELVAAKDVYRGPLKWQGRYKPGIDLEELREDR